jgi:hypothetical protein
MDFLGMDESDLFQPSTCLLPPATKTSISLRRGDCEKFHPKLLDIVTNNDDIDHLIIDH